MVFSRLFFGVFMFLLVLSFGVVNGRTINFVTVGTGSQTGTYYVVGQSVCRFVNRLENYKCSSASTAGSIFNINSILRGRQTIGIAQSDIIFNVLNGEGTFKDLESKDKLRGLFSLYTESFTMLVRDDSGINSFKDIRNKRVNLGGAGSGSRMTLELLMSRMGIKISDLKFATDLKPSEQAGAICDDKVDAIFYVVGHPNGSIKEATSSCATRLINISGDIVDNFIKENNYFVDSRIDGKFYNQDDVDTFGVSAVLMTSSDVSDDEIYLITKSIFENLDTFRRLHPALKDLDKSLMVVNLGNIPIHEGAKRYYKEVGLIH